MVRGYGNKQVLKETVWNAKTKEDLQPILSSLSLDQIKQVLEQTIDDLDSEQTQTLFYNSTSIIEILPQDVFRYILTFNEISDLLNISNEIDTMAHAQRVKISNKQVFETLFNKIDNNNTLVVDPLKYDEFDEDDLPWNICYNVPEAIEKAKPGDTVLLYYELDVCNEVYEIDKDIQFIGTNHKSGEDSILYGCTFVIGKTNGCNVYFDNIEIYEAEGIEVHENSALQAFNCKFTNSEIHIKDKANVYCKRCHFIRYSTIKVFASAHNIHFLNCLFDCSEVNISPMWLSAAANYYKSDGSDDENAEQDYYCIEICDSSNIGQNASIAVKCVANIFLNRARHDKDTTNTWWYPLFENDNIYVDRSRYEMKHNVLVSSMPIMDANKVYW